MSEDNSESFSMMERTNLLGQVGMILCWYWGDEAEDDPGREGETMVRAVQLAPSFLRGEYDEFKRGDWWLYVDAIGSYDERDAVLDELYEIARRGHEGTLDLENTKDFLSFDDEDDYDEDDLDDPKSNGMPRE